MCQAGLTFFSLCMLAIYFNTKITPILIFLLKNTENWVFINIVEHVYYIPPIIFNIYNQQYFSDTGKTNGK